MTSRGSDEHTAVTASYPLSLSRPCLGRPRRGFHHHGSRDNTTPNTFNESSCRDPILQTRIEQHGRLPTRRSVCSRTRPIHGLHIHRVLGDIDQPHTSSPRTPLGPRGSGSLVLLLDTGELRTIIPLPQGAGPPGLGPWRPIGDRLSLPKSVVCPDVGPASI